MFVMVVFVHTNMYVTGVCVCERKREREREVLFHYYVSCLFVMFFSPFSSYLFTVFTSQVRDSKV